MNESGSLWISRCGIGAEIENRMKGKGKNIGKIWDGYLVCS